MRTILPVDWYLEMVLDGEMISTYVLMHDCDGHGTCGTGIHVHNTDKGFVVKCDNDSCNVEAEVQQK